MLHRLTILTLLLFCCAGALTAQRIDHVAGQLIVQLGAGVDAKSWRNTYPGPGKARQLGRSANILVIDFDHDAVRESELFRQLYLDPTVELVQYNHPIEHRRRPNDIRYDDLWSFNNTGQLNGIVGADINVEPAWDVTTGGVTANGDTIVVAVIDDGTDLDHEDLVGNLWRNHGEIPNNGVDDDGNGYVDDYFGFDTANDDGNPEATGGHGTPVAGIIGASGNNGLGVTGVNWDVQLMTIRNDFFTSEVEVIQAYSYVLDQRLLYEQSSGARGAYVVVTNASWGRNFGRPADSPIWCDLYDQLGRAGILNVGATADLNIDVDAQGDLPTNCPSEYLIGVTSLNTNGVKPADRGFGATSVDLGAHAEQVLTTTLGNGYGRFGATSAAAPHVTGAVALLYSAPCAALGELLQADPAAAAIYIRRILLETTAPNASLSGRTVTGGQLDVGAAMARLMSECGTCFEPTAFTITPEQGSATSLVVDFNAVASIDDATLRYRSVGATEWVTVNAPTLPVTIPNLAACAAYEFELLTACGGQNLPTQRRTVTTDGCCVIPADFTVRAGDNLAFRAQWTPNLAGEFYRVRYRAVGTDGWLTRSSRSNNVIIAGGILPCTEYEFEFRTDCDTAQTDFGARLRVVSSGCGACVEETYCTPTGNDNRSDWIEAVNIANVFTLESGPEIAGYGDFTAGTEVSFRRGATYPITLTPGTSSSRVTEIFRIYVDWDQNGQFTSDEASGDATSVDRAPVTINLTVPDGAVLRSTRMRVMMNFLNFRGTACSPFAVGEYEDYCVSILEADPGCPPPKLLTAEVGVDGNGTTLRWGASAAAGNDYRLRYRPSGSGGNWTDQNVTGIEFQAPGLNLCGNFEVEIASVCNGTVGPYGAFRIDETCTDTDEAGLPDSAWALYPNPATNRVALDLRAGLNISRLRVYSATGRLLIDRPGSSTEFLLGQYPTGLYLVEILSSGGRRGVKKVLKR